MHFQQLQDICDWILFTHFTIIIIIIIIIILSYFPLVAYFFRLWIGFLFLYLDVSYF